MKVLMKGSVDKLRWGLAGGSLLLLLVLVGYVGYGRYKALRTWKSRLDKLGLHIDQQTDGFTMSQSLKGRTVFTLHAAKAIQHGEGKVTFHDVVITLYGHGTDSVDRIYGNQFEYDDKEGVARAVGDVQMDLRAPGALAKAKDGGAAPRPEVEDAKPGSSERDIHVRTSGLVYVRKLGIAATDQQVDFNYAGLECTSKGAEFETGGSTVHLLADVQLHGNVRNKPLVLHAGKADLNRTENTIALVNADVESGAERAQAANALFHMRSDGSVETAQAAGNLVLSEGSRRVTAARGEGSFNKDSVPEQAKLLGNVVLTDSDAARPIHGAAAELDAMFDPSGAPAHMVATGGAQIEESAPGQAGDPRLARSLRGTRMEAEFKPGRAKGRSELDAVHVMGSALATGESAVPLGGIKTTRIEADDLRAKFVAGMGRASSLQQVLGDGHTRLQQDAPHGEQQISSGDKLQMEFAQTVQGSTALQIASATQTGHVQVQSRQATRPAPAGSSAPATTPEPMFASGDRAEFDGASAKLRLTGAARFTQGDTSVSAATVVVDQRLGDSDAEGEVLATFNNAQQRDAPATHIRSDTAHLQHATEMAEFHGTEGRQARLWQGPSQIEAAALFLDGKRHTLAARPERSGGLVHAVFAGTDSTKPHSATAASSKSGNQVTQVARITANTMDYDDAARAATFSDHVHAEGETGEVQSEHAVAFLTPAQAAPAGHVQSAVGVTTPFGGSLQRIVSWGDVRIAEPGRTGQGERLVYTAAESSFVLTGSPGKPPQIADAKQGSVTGAALLFRSGDSTILVSGGNQASAGGTPGRVRTETGAKQ